MLLLGVLAGRFGFIHQESLSDSISLILKILLPCMLVSFICKNATRELLIDRAPLCLLTCGFYLIVITVTAVVARILPLNRQRAKTFQLIFIFGNTGFIGLPLLSSLFPQTGALDLALFMLIDQLFFWTYGLRLATTQEETNLSQSANSPFDFKNFLNPNIIAIVITFCLVMANIPLPDFLMIPLSSIGNAASPLCMICLGAMCYFSNMRKVLASYELYVGIFVKMIILPIILGRILIACSLPLDHSLIVSLIIMMAMPATTLVPLCVEEHGCAEEVSYATSATVVTIVASVITIPLVACILSL